MQDQKWSDKKQTKIFLRNFDIKRIMISKEIYFNNSNIPQKNSENLKGYLSNDDAICCLSVIDILDNNI